MGLKAEEALAAAQQYTDDSMAGAGAVAGAPCQVSDKAETSEGTTWNWKWKDNNGVEHTTPMEVKNGADGQDGAPGQDGEPGQDGTPGNGITSIEKTSTSGNVDTYTITFDDGTNTTFTVTNGTDGEDGEGVPEGGTTGQILKKKSGTDYDTEWVDPAGETASLDGLSDVNIGTLTDGDVLKYDAASGKWVNGAGAAVDVSMSDLDDVDLTSLANGDVLVYNSTSQKWERSAALSDKVDKVQGKGLSTNDYTDADKAEVAKVADKADAEDVIDGASYDSTNHLILFKNGTTTLFSLDAAAFVKDGMVDTVTITGGNLVITFNTDAGKQAISIPITDIFDPANYYDKTATDGLLADKVSKSNTAGLLKNDGTVDTDTFVKTSSTAGLLKNDGTVDTTTYATKASIDAIKDGQNIDSFADVETALDGKADKVTSAVSGNFAGLDASGNLIDSGKKASDFVSAANLDALNQIAAGIYEGTDLTVKFADEIANYTDEWAWVQARLDAHDVSSMLPGDYIPIVVGAETHQAQIAGINPYFDTCDSGYEVKYHIDWITRDCYGGATVKWNNSDNNNGSAAEASPFLASNLNSWLNSTLYGLLEAKLKAVIKEKRILAPTRYQSGQTLTDDNSWAWKTTGKLWVPYETEIFDNVQWSTKGFGESQNVQYEIFRNSYRARRKKQGPTGARAYWWTASASSGNATHAVGVSGNGVSYGYSASGSCCAPVCFRTMATT